MPIVVKSLHMKSTLKNKFIAPEKYQIVDLVRAFAILVVLAVHFGSQYISSQSQPFFLAYLWYRFWSNGGYGVSIFFVVSGFIITRLIDSMPGGLFNPDYQDFYARRIGRIFPLLTLVCLIGVIVSLFFDSSHHDVQITMNESHLPMNFSFWASIATFTFNWFIIFSEPLRHQYVYPLHWHVLWSLAVEEQFYLFYPLVLKRLKNEKNLIIFMFSLIIFGMVFGTYAGRYIFFNYRAFVLNSFSSFISIAVGCLLYIFSKRYKKYLSNNKKTSTYICLSGFFLINLYYWHHYVLVESWWISTGTYAVVLGVFLFLLGGLHLRNFESKHWAIPAFIGKLSYGGYLYHIFILFLLWPFMTGKNEYLDFLIYVTATFGIAHLSYRYFEIPANLFIRKALEKNE